MRKILVSIMALVSIVILTLVMVSCSTSSSSSSSATTTTTSASGTTTTTTSTTTTSGAAASSITISGRLTSGSISGRNVESYATAVEGGTVLLLNNDTNEFYSDVTDSNGDYSISVPAGSYSETIIDSDNAVVGPVRFATVSATSVGMVLSVESTTSTYTVDAVVDTNSNLAAASTDLSDDIDSSYLSTATDYIPIGASGLGFISTTVSETREGGDPDSDGVFFGDRDYDGDGDYNGIDSTPPLYTSADSPITNVNFTSNVWASIIQRGESVASLMTTWIQVRISSDETVSSITCEAPTAIGAVATINDASSLGNAVDYPESSSLWSDDSFNLYEITSHSRQIQEVSEGDLEYAVMVNPNSTPEAGHSFTIYLETTGGSYQAITTQDLIINDYPKYATINGFDPMQTVTAEGNSQTTPFTVVTSEASTAVTFVIQTAKDDGDNVIEGLRYQFSASPYSTEEGGALIESGDLVELAHTDEETLTTVSTLAAEVDGSPVVYKCIAIADTNVSNSTTNGENIWIRVINP